MWKLLRAVACVLLVAAPVGAAQSQPSAPPGPIDRVFSCLYDYDFAGAHAILDAHTLAEPGDPLAYSARAVVYLFSELGRLKILETDFFLNDDNLVDDRKLQPDPVIRTKFFEAVEQARRRASARLAVAPDDQGALFAMCMSAGVVADYTGLVERRQWRGLTLSRETKKYADKLLALTPPFYDAYHTVGTLEYVVGSMPFFFRWFVRIDQISGDKRKGIEALKLVARYGRYYGPFARIMLSIISLREGKLEDARTLLATLAAEHPRNPLLKRELQHVSERIRAAQARRK